MPFDSQSKLLQNGKSFVMTILPQKVNDLAQAVRVAGGRAMLVGGCVRDELMGIEPKDWDVEIYGVEPIALREILDTFGEVNVVGEAFAVYKIGNDLVRGRCRR